MQQSGFIQLHSVFFKHTQPGEIMFSSLHSVILRQPCSNNHCHSIKSHCQTQLKLDRCSTQSQHWTNRTLLFPDNMILTFCMYPENLSAVAEMALFTFLSSSFLTSGLQTSFLASRWAKRLQKSRQWNPGWFSRTLEKQNRTHILF